MKKIAIICAAAIALSACGEEAEQKAQKLQEENHKLYLSAVDRNEELGDYKKYILKIKDNLASLKSREHGLIMQVNQGDVDRSTIMTDLELISDCLDHNRYTLAVLQKELKNRENKSTQLSNEIVNLQAEIMNKGQTLSTTMDSLHLAMARIAGVEEEQEGLYEELMAKEDALHEVYFAYGTFKEMKTAAVAEKRGGILGLGAVKTLQADFNTEYFSKIDKRLTQEIPIYRAEASLLTSHPADSFEWVGSEEGIDALKITDPDKFWKSTKYLAVLVE